MGREKVFGLESKKGRWIFIPIGIILFMCLGTVYSWSVFRKPLEEIYNIGATQSGLPYMMFLASYAALMPISGVFIEKYSPRRIMLLGGLFVGLGWIISGYVNNINLLAITYGVIAGSGVGIIYGVPVAVISKWFYDKKGLAVGLILTGFGLSPLVTAPLAEYLIEIYGPLSTFKFLGVAFLIIITLLSLPFKFPEESYVIRNNTISNKENKIIDVNTKDMIKNKRFYGLWICYGLGTLMGLMSVGITSIVGEEIIKLDPRQTATLLSLFAIFNASGRPLFGWITDKLSPLKSSLIAYGLIIVASALMLVAQSGNLALFIISFSLIWMTLGGWLAIAPTATGIFFGSKYHSRNYGIIFTAYGVGAVLGVSISGMFRDYFGSYEYIFYPMILVAILGSICAIVFLKEKEKIC